MPAVNYNPDVLSCLANLSNDEVFTPPEIANAMLDMLPQELFSDPNAKFLDPACKTGVFLREIAKRLIKGLETKIPDLQERLDHIFHEQLYAIAITELTALVSRRSTYCSKKADGIYSISQFNTPDGNIRYQRTEHKWDGVGRKDEQKCVICGASRSQFDRGKELETHAYEFIHKEDIYKMKFDLIIGNPPYQLNTAGDENGAQAKPLYHLFIQQAMKLKPRFLSMIVPARWFTGGWGLDDFRSDMMNNTHIREIHDFPNASDCFPGVEIKGGVCYFLQDLHYDGKTLFNTHSGSEIISKKERYLKEKNCDIIIRYNDAIDILHKVMSLKEETFDSLVSTKKPFGLITNYHGSSKTFEGAIKVYGNKRVEFVKQSEITRRPEDVSKPKVIVPKAVGSGTAATDIIKPLYCEPGSCCTETYLLVGPFENKKICENVISYFNTKFFHFLVTIQKQTQDCMKRVYSLVPIQDFSKSWTDAELYSKYNLSREEIDYIEKTIWPEAIL